jgi:hypothetical protein
MHGQSLRARTREQLALLDERDELTVTRAPSPANLSATARPMPLDDPVTTTTSLTPGRSYCGAGKA